MGPSEGHFLERKIKGSALLQEGDKNTSLFHKTVNAHSRKNFLNKIKINGTWFSKENEIKDGVVQAFLF